VVVVPFELADQGTGASLGIGPSLEVVAAEVVVGVSLASKCQTMTIMVWATAKMALASLLVPKRRLNRRYWAAR
jgi:hypothetical protein